MFESKGLIVVVYSLLLLLLLSPVDARWTRRPRRTTTPRITTEKADRHQHVHHWPPLVAPQPAPAPVPAPVAAPVPAPASAAPPSPPQAVWKPSLNPRLIDSFDRRSADGQYEFRFQLDNGNTRYERAYWLPVGKDLVLAKKGYYSVPLPNDQFSTIFYTADNRGYHVDMQTLSGQQPLLPRSLEVPGVEPKMETGTGTGSKRNSISDPERNEQEDVEEAGDVDTSVAGTERVPDTVSQVKTETETETEPSTLANDILATEAAADSHEDDDDDDDPEADADVDDDEGDSN